MKRFVTAIIILAFVSACAWGQKPVAKTDLLKDPEWQKIYDAYQPDAGLIANLKNRAPQLRADVVFAFWCDDSKNHVPVFLKILDAIAVPEFKVNFYEVERKATADQKFYAEDMMVEKVPTFIFYANDFELGRIVENPTNSILQDMMIIVF